MSRRNRSLTRSVIMGGALMIVLGVLVGLGTFTFVYAKGTSYLSNDPATCVNCHIMRDQYEAWQVSSHRNVAVCNDCHTPHDAVAKWTTKAINGFNHSLAFTTGDYPAVIQIKQHNAEIAQENCIGCHQTLVNLVYGTHADQTRRCVDCHGNVGHQNRSTQ
ncbi:MAG: cytochrome c nitrite reductase small subunit [Anaerolineae bacterium]|nr:cytochrome c nitrite reductase small subunit [Anaerolineae bacterium]NUQ04128.1 cytochrome c nitrite reductase small subunit [Anaerolineae bacterium]